MPLHATASADICLPTIKTVRALPIDIALARDRLGLGARARARAGGEASEAG